MEMPAEKTLSTGSQRCQNSTWRRVPGDIFYRHSDPADQMIASFEITIQAK